MRELNGHKVNPANDVLTVHVLDEPGSGGAHHLYQISGFHTVTNRSDPFTFGGHIEPTKRSTILFQNGPINDVGVNGVTHEALLAILIDRLECFQNGPFANDFNKSALWHLREAQTVLLNRTRERMARGVEGTHAK